VSARFLLDTTVLSEPLRPKPHPLLLANLQRHREELATAAVVWHELLFGCDRLPPSNKKAAIERYLSEVLALLSIFPYDTAAAEWHAAERARLSNEGRTPPYADGQIAAIARVNDLTIVTANVADYGSFQGIRVEDWTGS
jgi:tRNA(fMet)-specific endonuclease VapC